MMDYASIYSNPVYAIRRRLNPLKHDHMCPVCMAVTGGNYFEHQRCSFTQDHTYDLCKDCYKAGKAPAPGYEIVTVPPYYGYPCNEEK